MSALAADNKVATGEHEDSCFIDDCAESGDEFENGTFHDRLADVYREHSPSRRRRLAGASDESPSMTFQGALPVFTHPLGSLTDGPQCPPVGPPAFVPPVPVSSVPAPSFVGEALFLDAGLTQAGNDVSPSRPRHIMPSSAAVCRPLPTLSSVHSHQPPADSRRSSAASEREELYNVDLKLRSGEAKESAASTQPPSSPTVRESGGNLSDGSGDDFEQGGFHHRVGDVIREHSPVRQKPTASGPTSAIDPVDVQQRRLSHDSDGRASDGKPTKLAWEEGVVTVMIRQIPRHYTQLMVLGEVVRRGFKGYFDFLYLPFDIKKGTNVGYGFVNFVDPKHTETFRQEFDCVFLDINMRYQNKPLRIHPASVQGYEANRHHFLQTKTGQKQDPQFSPLFFPGGSWAEVTDRAVLDAEHVQLLPAAAPSKPPRWGSWDGLLGAPPGVLTAPPKAQSYPSAPLGVWGAAPQAPLCHSHLGAPPVAPGAYGVSVLGADFAPSAGLLSQDFNSLEDEKNRLLAELAVIQEEQRRTLAGSLSMANAAAASAACMPPPPATYAPLL